MLQVITKALEKESGKTRKENKKLRSVLVEAARAVARTKDTYLSVQYHLIVARRGDNRAAVAIAHSILSIMDQDEVWYTGRKYFDDEYWHWRSKHESNK